MLRWNKLRKTSVLIISAFLNSCYTLMLAFIFSLVCYVYPIYIANILCIYIDHCLSDKDNLCDSQELLKLLIISFILMTFIFDSRVIL